MSEMDEKQYIDYIIDAFEDNGLGDFIDEAKAKKFYDFHKLLTETNKTTNLTAITKEKDVILKHFLDCATVCVHLPENCKLLDVGCGAGFPSLPVAILRGDVSVTSIDSTGKKINFVSETARKLELCNLDALCCRAEDFAKDRRESFDVCVSRAVARLNVLSELCLPFVKVGGAFVAMKSEKGAEEYAEAKCGIEKLGGALKQKISPVLNLESNSVSRELYLITKIKQTPANYPRNYSQISKKPL